MYRKSHEGKERELYEKKRKIRQCLEDGRPIPTELRKEEEKLREEMACIRENVEAVMEKARELTSVGDDG